MEHVIEFLLIFWPSGLLRKTLGDLSAEPVREADTEATTGNKIGWKVILKLFLLGLADYPISSVSIPDIPRQDAGAEVYEVYPKRY